MEQKRGTLLLPASELSFADGAKLAVTEYEVIDDAAEVRASFPSLAPPAPAA